MNISYIQLVPDIPSAYAHIRSSFKYLTWIRSKIRCSRGIGYINNPNIACICIFRVYAGTSTPASPPTNPLNLKSLMMFV